MHILHELKCQLSTKFMTTLIWRALRQIWPSKPQYCYFEFTRTIEWQHRNNYERSRHCESGTRCESVILWYMHAPRGALGPSQTHDQCTRNNGRRIYASIKEFMQARRIYASTTVLRASLLSDFHIQRYCQWYGCSMAYFDKADEGLETQASVGKSLALHFVSVRQTSRQTLFQFTLFGASRQTLFQFTETGGAQRRAA